MASIDSVPARAKDQLPAVLLTLLSIVQALALELLWAHITSNEYLYQPTWLAVMSWIQIAATFLGVVLIWLIYTSMTMRFRWVPTISDSVLPFVIGIIEFTLIAALGAQNLGWWFLDLALIFGLMAWVSQVTLRRARLDGENDAYFANIRPATLHDFYPAIGAVTILVVLGCAILATGDEGWLAAGGLLFASAALAHQTHLNNVFWKRSILPK